MFLNAKKYGMIPYVIPFVLYLLFSQVAARYHDLFPWLYIATAVMVSGATIYLLSGRYIYRAHKDLMPGILFGIVGIVLWIVLSRTHFTETIVSSLPVWLRPEPRQGFNPFESISSPLLLWIFLLVRSLSLVLLVPVVEELFWRGFLLRWVISANWEEQALGIFTLRSFLWVVLLFTLAHPEWLAAAVYCALMNILLYWKKDLWLCIVAHSTSNLLLVIYILMTGSWELW